MMISTTRSHVVAIFISCVALLGAHTALADQPPVPSATETKGDAAAAAQKILETLQSASTAQERLDAAGRLAVLRPAPIAFYGETLKRSRSSTDAERRAVLAKTNAEVPDENGKFATPQRETKKSERENDIYDWLADLVKLPAQPGLSDVLIDVAVIRALSASENPEGGTFLVDFAFSEDGLAFRDECGRYLRIMAPYSLPALIRGSQNHKNSSMRRYTDYQLERLDRQNPHKAFDAAASESLQIAILEAFADSQYREAVYPVLDNLDHVAPRVRKVARATWMEFVDGRPPIKPPERKLELTNGRLSDEKSPLWLDHRVLAQTAIAERLAAVTGEKPNPKASLLAMTEKLFAYYDDKRSQEHLADFQSAMEMASAGKSEEAIVIFDRILASDPEFPKRAEMVPAYLQHAEKLSQAEKWQEAAIAFGKASAIAPDNAQAQAALKQHHLARAKVAESQGKDSSTEKDIAGEITETAQSPATAPSKSKLILFAGLAAIAGAIVLFLLGIALRRRPSGAH